MSMEVMTNDEVIRRWRTLVLPNAGDLDAESVQATATLHSFYSIWTGFVMGLNRPDLASYQHYIELGVPKNEPWEFKV